LDWLNLNSLSIAKSASSHMYVLQEQLCFLIIHAQEDLAWFRLRHYLIHSLWALCKKNLNIHLLYSTIFNLHIMQVGQKLSALNILYSIGFGISIIFVYIFEYIDCLHCWEFIQLRPRLHGC